MVVRIGPIVSRRTFCDARSPTEGAMETKMIEFARPDGKKAPGYLEMPAAGKDAPGVVVIQEWWGLNDQIKGVADRLAKAGYRALVPDLFRGKIAKDKSEANHLSNTLD